MWLVRNPKDFLAGLLFMAFGVAALVIGWSYPLGTISRMGPGYFPRILAVLLIGLGGLLSLRGFRPGEEPCPRWHGKPLGIVLLSAAVFGFAGEWVGVVGASLALVLVSSLASEECRWKEALISSVIQAVAAAAIFVYGLGVPLPVWPVIFMGGR